MEADISEVQIILQEIRHTLRHLHRWARPRRVDPTIFTLGTRSKVIMEPKGVCLIISPWNFPFNLCIGPLIHAISAGNTAILKPSDDTPNTAALISEMIEELYPAEDVAVFQGGVEVSRELLSLPFDHIFFTGSPRVGRFVMEAASKNLSSVTLELGGKTPVVVDPSADLKDAAEKIAWGKLLNNGQACVAPDYLLVHHIIAERFTDLLKEQFAKIYDPEAAGFKESQCYGRLINERHFRSEVDFIDDALKNGAKLIFGGKHDEQNLFIEPTLIIDTTDDMKVLNEEIFGPILPVIQYKESEDVVQMINSKPKPLGINIFSKDRQFTNYIVKATTSGAVAINDTIIQFGHPSLPFGGTGESGLGKSHGYYGFRAFSNEKACVQQRIGQTVLKLIYPPYNKLTKLILDIHHKYL